MNVDQVLPSKRDLRRLMLQRRTELSDRATRSAAICTRLETLEVYRQAAALHCYLPMGAEVDIWPLLGRALAAGKQVAVPVVQPGAVELAHSWLLSAAPDDLEPGIFGTSQPRAGNTCDPAACALIIVPLLAFDHTCNRLGYGKGYYDRLLARVAAPAIGVAFAAQEVPQLPITPCDVPLQAIVTEDTIIWRPNSAFVI